MAEEREGRKGVKPILFEVPNAEYDAFVAFCEARGSTKKAEMLAAMRRHMASPPPLPEAVPLPPPRPRGRPRKASAN